jgi:hypothetical protein
MNSPAVRFTKFHGTGVAKSYAIVDDTLQKISAPNFSVGTFETITVTGVKQLREFIEALQPGDFLTAGIHETLSSGVCGPGDSDIHRKIETFPFASGEPGLLIIDGDNLHKMGLLGVKDFASALGELVGDADFVLSPSASSGITYKGVIGQVKGIHAFLFIEDAATIPATLEALHKRSVLCSYAWPLISESGTILIRSIVDTAMKSPNQPCFEGGAVLGDGITQDRWVEATKPVELMMFVKVEPITAEEEAAYELAVQTLSSSVSKKAEQKRAEWRQKRGKALAQKGCPPEKIRQILDSALSRERPVLNSDFEILTDHHGVLTVREILADRVKYHGETCHDPLDWDYGKNKAKIYCNNGGRPTIHSFAHGEATYILKDDVSREQSRIIGEGSDQIGNNFQKIMDLPEMLEKYAYIEHGKGVVPRGNPSAILAFDEFKLATAGSFLKIEERAVPIANMWIKSEERLTAHTRTFRPGAGEFTADPEGINAINLWVPGGPVSTPEYYEDCAQPFFDHVSYLIPDELMLSLFLDYLAHIEQRPGEKAGFGWLMVTDETQGIGRNWMTGVLARIWSSYTALDFNLITAIKDSFTGRLSKKLLVVVNEIVATQVKDRHEFVERTKNLVTDETIEINPKFGRRHTEYLLARWIIFSNHIAAMPLSDHDRRFAVVQNPSTPMPAAYYQKLYALHSDAEFIASVRRVLAEREINSDIQAKAPESKAKERVVEATRPPMDSALMEIKGCWPGDLIRASVCKQIVKHLMGLSDDELTENQSAALNYAYRRCSFVSLDKKNRFGTKVERVYALRDAEKWNELSKTDSGVQLMRDQLEDAVQRLPMTDNEKKALGDGANWGAAFERLQNAADATPGPVAALPLVAATV